MSHLAAFEIFTYYDGQWKLDSAYDDREIALFEARRALERPRCMGVRINEEIFHQETGKYETRTIFRKTKLDSVNHESVERQKKLRETSQGRTKAANPRNKKESTVKTHSDAGLVFRIVLAGAIVLSGICAILALRSLGG